MSERIDPRVVIRDVVEADLSRLADLMAASPLMVRYAVGRERALESLEEALSLGDVLLIASAEDGAVGGLAWLQRLRGFGGAAYLRLLLVSEAEQGRGIGGRLLAAAEQRAPDWSRHVLLLATEDNHLAHRFYERHGYYRAGQLPHLILPDADEIIYHKLLADQ